MNFVVKTTQLKNTTNFILEFSLTYIFNKFIIDSLVLSIVKNFIYIFTDHNISSTDS